MHGILRGENLIFKHDFEILAALATAGAGDNLKSGLGLVWGVISNLGKMSTLC